MDDSSMAGAAKYPRVFSPFRIGNVELKNRIFIPAHTTNFADGFLPTDKHVAYHRERAAGGIGLIFVEPLRVHRTALGRAGGLSGTDPRALPGLRAITKAIKAEGARVFVQITHTGRHSDNFIERLPPWAPSAIPWTASGEVPHVMTHREMEEVLQGYLATAELAIEAGFEGMEVHLGHGHLLHQFLSPACNARTDEFGGSFENRLRYPLDVVRAVVDTVASRAPVGVRLSVDDLMRDGCDAQASMEIARCATAIPGVAFINASVAAYHWPSIGHHVADMSYPSHPFLEQTVALRQVIGKLPLLTANRYTNLADAEEGLATGAIDMIGMNRAHIADPKIIAKTLKGDEADIRPCVSSNFCIGQIAVHRPITCMMNPRAGKEREWNAVPEPAALPRKILVVGGGPAGMEAARVAAERHHIVTLWDRADRLGGILTLAGTAAGRADLHKMRDYMERLVRKSSAVVETGKAADIEDILGFDADAVVLATGGRPAGAGIAGAGTIPTVQDALAASRVAWNKARVCILDASGSWDTLSAAETLATCGAAVTVVSRPDEPLWYINIYSRMTAIERLSRLGVRLRPGMVPKMISGDRLIASNKFTEEDESLGVFTHFLHASRSAGDDRLQSSLEKCGVKVFSIGDALAPRSLLEAVYDGHAIARAL
jgi:2,4-dienoyl-CoA reductase-like NADH-dependent reductase (Old Yellow Enzyme family)/thioredoxin reductase